MQYEKLTKITNLKGKTMKRISGTDLKYVSIVTYDRIKTYRANIPMLNYVECFEDIHEAAKAVDRTLLLHGKKQVNNTFKKS